MALRPDYDDDPERWGSWRPAQDVPDVVGPEMLGPLLDVGCGDGRLPNAVGDDVVWIGVDASWAQLASNPHRPVVLADMRALPFRAETFSEVAHLWCLYHVDDPVSAVAEAARVLRRGGGYFACTNSRQSDPELMWDGYPATPFDAEEAAEIVGEHFPDLEEERWDEKLYPLETREEVAAFCRHSFIPVERAERVELPLWLTKRGVLIRATKSGSAPAAAE